LERLSLCGAKVRFFLDSAFFFSLTTVNFVNSVTDFVNFETPPDEKCHFSKKNYSSFAFAQLFCSSGVLEFLELQTLVLSLLFSGDFKRAVYCLQLQYSLDSSMLAWLVQELLNSFNFFAFFYYSLVINPCKDSN
jgi:hypothetical protein